MITPLNNPVNSPITMTTNVAVTVPAITNTGVVDMQPIQSSQTSELQEVSDMWCYTYAVVSGVPTI